MQDKPMGADRGPATLSRNDEVWQQRDRFERALQDLVSGGLLHIRAGDLVLPTQPAVHFDALFEAA